MTADTVRELGYLTLGTRLKRIGDRMQAHTQRILDAHELDVQTGQFPFLAAIDRSGPLLVGELAEALGVTQPAATRMASQLAESGLLTIAQARDDLRCRTVSLTKQGQRLVDVGKRTVWPLIEAAVREICEQEARSGSLLERLAALEDALVKEPLDRRAAAIKRRRR
jgi:DNA-binding MarR family transcriptional regulator